MTRRMLTGQTCESHSSVKVLAAEAPDTPFDAVERIALDVPGPNPSQQCAGTHAQVRCCLLCHPCLLFVNHRSLESGFKLPLSSPRVKREKSRSRPLLALWGISELERVSRPITCLLAPCVSSFFACVNLRPVTSLSAPATTVAYVVPLRA